MIGAIKLALAFFPAPIQAVIIGIIAVLLLILIFRLIRMVLDAIPFL